MKKRTILALVLLLVVLISSLTSYSAAKYTDVFSGEGSVKFSRKLADSVTLTMTQPAKDEKDISTNILIPGYDIPATPVVSITGKSDIPAYLFLEVTDNTPNEHVIYALDGHWQTTTMKSTDGSSYYIYCADKANPTKIISTDYSNIPILAAVANGKEIEVRQNLLSGVKDGNSITFNVYLEEAAQYDNSGT